MTVFSIHDETGRITQSNKVYMADGYADTLRERNWDFVEHQGDHYDNLRQRYVFRGELSARPDMRASIDRRRIKAGEMDAAKIRRIPRGASVEIYAGTVPFFFSAVEGTSIDFSAPVPGVYLIALTCWPYRDWQAQVVVE